MKIIYDTFGGDNAPYEVIKGAIEAVEEFNIDVIFVGNKEDINNCLNELNFDKEVEIVEAEEKILNTDEPAFAIRQKKNSSIVIGLNLLKEGKGDAFISAGSTGALLAGGLFIIKRINNIKRAVLPTFWPGIKGNTLLIDSGANMDCTAELLVQFAKLAKIYLQSIYKIENPKIGLLNVGSEPGKGNNLTKEAYNLLKDSDLNFVGNIEARDISKNVCDAIICDGFIGNVLLKNAEGIVNLMIYMLKNTISNDDFSDGFKMESNKLFKEIIKKLDSKEVGGVPLIGLQKIIIKAHGDSNARAIKNATGAAIVAINNNIINKLEKYFNN